MAEENYSQNVYYIIKEKGAFRFKASARDLIFFVCPGSYITENELTYQFYSDKSREWSKEKNENSISLNSLSPGEHILIARIIHPMGFSEETETRFIIAPYWYETIPFKILLIILIIISVSGAVYGGTWWNTRRLQKKARELKEIVEERTRELKETQQHLITAARQAGKAEIAVEILHNARNLLNSINIRLDTIADYTKYSKLYKLFSANSLLKENINNLENFLLNDPKGKNLLQYYIFLADKLKEEYKDLIDDLDNITNSIRILMEFVASQNEYVTQNWFTEECFIEDLVVEALNVIDIELLNNNITSRVDFTDPGERKKLDTQPSKILHVLVSIYHNAIDALISSSGKNYCITTRVWYRDDKVICEIRVLSPYLCQLYNRDERINPGGK